MEIGPSQMVAIPVQSIWGGVQSGSGSESIARYRRQWGSGAWETMLHILFQ